MCLLCDQAAGRKFAAADHSVSSIGLSRATIEPEYLIDQDSADFTRRITATDAVLDYYLHASGGSVRVSGGGFGAQTIRSVSIEAADQQFFRQMIDRLDALIDLDFNEVFSASQADVDLYYDTEINLGGGGSGQTLGLATTSGSNWELFVNQPQVANDEAYRHYVLLHEFGHALGLEHPFEDDDGDVLYGNTDPWTSAYPEDTVMAYRSPSSGVWPDFYTQNDIQALQSFWGSESNQATDFADRLLGNDGDDEIHALEGDDRVEAGAGHDLIYGNQGADIILAGVGDDVVYGGQDADQIYGNEGDDRLYGNKGDDLIYGGKSNDWLHGGQGDDDLYGNLGADVFNLSAGSDRVMDFQADEGDLIAIRPGVAYSIHAVGVDLQIKSDLGSLLLVGVAVDAFNSSQSVFVG